MPQVGKKHFAYNAKGVKAANALAKKTGKKVKNKKPKKAMPFMKGGGY